MELDWSSLIFALLGTVVGGIISVVSQELADRRRERAALRTESRASELASIERARTYTRDLHDQISEDIADLDVRLSESNQEVDQRRAEMLDDLLIELNRRANRAGALIALVEDEAVRTAVDKMYSTWAAYLVTEGERMLASQAEKDVDDQSVREARGAFTAAVRSHLRQLGEKEQKVFEQT